MFLPKRPPKRPPKRHPHTNRIGGVPSSFLPKRPPKRHPQTNRIGGVPSPLFPKRPPKRPPKRHPPDEPDRWCALVVLAKATSQTRENTKRPPNDPKTDQKKSQRNAKMGAMSNGPHLGAKTGRKRPRKTSQFESTWPKNEAGSRQRPRPHTTRLPNDPKTDQKKSRRNTKMGAISNGPHLGAKTITKDDEKHNN